MATSAMTDTKSYLADVPQEFAFWVCDGQILKNLRELRDAFAVMNDYTFTYHVNEAKNDFHNWVKDIVRDDALAGQLLKAANPVVAVRVVTERIAFLSARPASTPVRKQAPAPASKPAATAPKAPSSSLGKTPSSGLGKTPSSSSAKSGSRKQTRR